MKKTKQNGITLIALVITIIVLLILAGVSIATLTGENGIVTRANEASMETELGNITEQINLLDAENVIDRTLDNTTDNTLKYLKDNQIIDDNNVIDTEKLLKNKTQYGNGETTDIFKIKGNEVVYIDSKGNEVASQKISITTGDPQEPESTTNFITEWKVEVQDENQPVTLILPISIGYKGDNNFVVDWGDGSQKEVISDEETPLEEYPQHQYTKSGNYRISISGKCSYFSIEELESNQAEMLVKLVSWGEIQADGYEFSGAINLDGAIPSPTENTFQYYDEDQANYLFYNCSKIDSIPADLFANMPEEVNSFAGTFNNCTELKSIPENLFANVPNAQIFNETFKRCSGLTDIPENLFANNTKVTDFSGVFAYCTGLSSIPENLFANNKEATNFEETFYKCANIRSIPEKIFDNNPAITNLSHTFYGLTEITTAPKLWEKFPDADGTACFGSCDKLDEQLLEEMGEEWR